MTVSRLMDGTWERCTIYTMLTPTGLTRTPMLTSLIGCLDDYFAINYELAYVRSSILDTITRWV